MKRLLTFSLCLNFFLYTSAQTDSSRVEQYCELVATAKILSNKVNIEIDFGQERSMWKDNRLKDDNGKSKTFNSVVDALNYMGQSGWILVNAFLISEPNGPKVYHYVFKKLFTKKETE